MNADDCSLDDLRSIVEVTTDVRDYPHAADVVDNVLVYDCEQLRAAITTTDGRRSVQSELAAALADGPGLVVFAGAFPDTSIVDRVTEVFEAIIEDQHAAGQPAGDHYAKPGANDRIWNALEKLALRDPDAFVEYYGNEIIELASSAWLGPFFQITSQVNVVNPGGAAQVPHRDYHLGFTSIEVAEQFPAHAHRLSAVLTLQGAIAHTDMPVESGPTMYLPHSQKYELGYLGWRRPDFAEYFAEHHVQLPLTKGDAGFFNPARVARRRTQPHVRRQADGQPAAAELGVRPADRDGEPRSRFERAVPGAPAQRAMPALPRSCCTTRSPPAPRATRSQPTSTAINRSAGWSPTPRPSSCGGPCRRTGSPSSSAPRSRDYAERHLTDSM